MEASDSIRYRRMPFQIKYKKDLNLIESSDASEIKILNHFARNGYENLYLTQMGKLSAVLTLDDFLCGDRIEGLNREFILELKDFHTSGAIISFFIDHPHIDRLSIVDDGELVCEVDGLIELPIQNGTAKNIMALRYLDIFYDDLTDYFEHSGRIFLIADNSIVELIKAKFPNLHFDSANDLDELPEKFYKDYDVLMDFVYSKNIRRAIGFSPENLIGMSQLMTRFAIKKLHRYCLKKGVQTRFYRVQNFEDLTCMNAAEYNNCINRVKTGKLLQNEEYISRFVTNEAERVYLKNREYHASLRLDDGYCFVQDECNEPSVHVHKGVRKSFDTQKINDETARIHFYGPCITYGFLMPDEETIPSLVCKYASEKCIDISVKNQAGIHGYNELNALMTALNTPVKRGDFMIFYDSMDDLAFSEYPEGKQSYEWFNAEKNPEDVWFLDFPGHCSFRANQLIARHIYEDIEPDIGRESDAVEGRTRSSFVGDGFDRMGSMKITHSSCIKFFRKYEGSFFDNTDAAVIGAVIIPDSYNYDAGMKLASKAAERCDELYILKYNDNLEDIEMGRELFLNNEISVCRKPAKIMQLGYFFDSSRYLPEITGNNNCQEEYLFTERALAEVILREMNVSIRYIPRGTMPDIYKRRITELYRNNDIGIEYV